MKGHHVDSIQDRKDHEDNVEVDQSHSEWPAMEEGKTRTLHRAHVDSYNYTYFGGRNLKTGKMTALEINEMARKIQDIFTLANRSA